MRFTHIDVNFDVKYEGHQNCSKILSMHILRVLVTIICDIKIDISMCEPHYVLSPNLTKKFQWEGSQIAKKKFPCAMLLGGSSVNLNHLKRKKINIQNELLHTPHKDLYERM